MRRLDDHPEHLDGSLADRHVLEGNLRDLARINRTFGGVRLSIEAIRAVVRVGDSAGPAVRARRSARLHVLDVGTGAADIPIALARAAGPWSGVEVTATDSRREILEAAGRISPDLRASDVTLAEADGRSLPYGDGSFDVAHASLVLHHLSRADAVAFLAELSRVARLGVVVNDLARSRLNLVGAWLVLHALTRNPWTLHDGVLSVRRAWTLAEATALAETAGLRTVHTATAFAGHRWALAAVPG
jgi:ubiquinone/menaquinone biosynthesis C-methylase UbiE